jgi:hypothetical protein
MEKTTQPQQLSFSFEEPETRHTVVSLAPLPVLLPQDTVADSKASLAIVYDFRSAATKRKESTHASLYRQILDSVRHIG